MNAKSVNSKSKPIDAKSLIAEGETLFHQREKLDNYYSQPNSILETDYTNKLIETHKNLYSKIPDFEKPKSLHEVTLTELKVGLKNLISEFEQDFNSKSRTPDEVIDILQIKKEDFDEISNWLLENKEDVLKANKDLLENHSLTDDRIYINSASPKLRHTAEALLLEYLQIMEIIVKDSFSYLKFIDGVFKEYIIDIDSNAKASTASYKGRYALISTYSSTYIYEGKIKIDIFPFLEHYSHEVLGHLLQYYTTNQSNLPIFIKRNNSSFSSAISESITDYFESRIFDKLKEYKNIDKKLKFDKSFEEIYALNTKKKLLKSYNNKAASIGIYILAKSKKSDMEKQIAEFSKYAISPSWPSRFVNHYKDKWDETTGLLMPNYVRDLKYSVNFVDKYLNQNKDKIKTEEQLNHFENVILEGFWTPSGFKNWVDFNIKKG